ncbi:MAG: ATP-binding protein [Chloroflexi bacterium]|nr:ATP-binding protein [Chloroflexota bacterium]
MASTASALELISAHLAPKKTQRHNADCDYPCPCGYFGDPVKPCTCTPAMIARYQAKLSGPLLDRIDIHIDVPRVEYDKLLGNERSESSVGVRNRIEAARARQRERFAGRGLVANADMGVSEIQELCVLKPEAKQMLDIAVRRMSLSARSYHRVVKLSRTIADLADCEFIQVEHVAEAIQYRPKAQSG